MCNQDINPGSQGKLGNNFSQVCLSRREQTSGVLFWSCWSLFSGETWLCECQEWAGGIHKTLRNGSNQSLTGVYALLILWFCVYFALQSWTINDIAYTILALNSLVCSKVCIFPSI